MWNMILPDGSYFPIHKITEPEALTRSIDSGPHSTDRREDVGWCNWYTYHRPTVLYTVLLCATPKSAEPTGDGVIRQIRGER